MRYQIFYITLHYLDVQGRLGCTRLVMAPQPPSAKNGTLQSDVEWTFPVNEIGATGLCHPNVLMMMMKTI